VAPRGVPEENDPGLWSRVARNVLRGVPTVMAS
jgi:hypothetical protein